MERPTLILCIDRDNDLYEKAKISGPVIGRDRNLLAVTKLGLADPEDSDVNAILAAIRIYDKMKSEGKAVEIATLTGDKRLGYEADKRISTQLEKIITERNPESAVLVTDGASDEEVFPIIKSRIKIDSTKIVIVKQSKELEKTYFILLEKLKDPYYAKILIGIPALLILLFSAADYLGVGWQPVGIVIGAYLIARMMGIDEVIGSAIRDFRFSIEKTSWLGYLAGFTLFLIALIVGYQNFEGGLEARLSSEKLVAYVLQGVLWPLLASFVFIIVGKSMDAMAEKKVYKLTKYSMYLIGAILTAMLLKIGTSWVLNIREPYVSFGDFLLAIVVAIFLGYISTLVISWIKFDVIKRMKIDGKEVVTSDGSLVGKIVGIDVKNEKLVVQGVLEKKYGYPFSSILAVDEKVVIKLEG